MTGSLIGALRVTLGLDSAQFQDGIKKARRDAEQGTKSMGDAFAGLRNNIKLVTAGIAAFASASVTMAIRDAANAMDDLSKSA